VSARTILVTDGEQRSALALVRSLGRAGHRVHVASANGRSLAGSSRFARGDHPVPDALATPEAHVDALAALAGRLGAEVVVPVTEGALLAVLRERARFDGVTIPFVELERFSAISDKARVLAEARAIGIAVPEALGVERREELTPAVARLLRYPVVLKPSRSVRAGTNGAAKHDVRHAADAAELMRISEELPASAFPLLVQRRIVGPGQGIFLLRWEGRTIARFAHRRLREKPPAGGVSVYSESVAADESLVAKSEALLDRFGWRGVAMVEYKLDAATRTPYLMEVNGRFWGSLQLAVDAGVDFPALLVSAAMGERPPAVTSYRVGARNRWWWGDVDQLLTRLRRSRRRLSLPPDMPGRLRAIGEFVMATLTPGRNEVLHLDDPRPFVHETLNWVRGR
jgi:predicted ATP-grasp superfamily ATP-dependent carboligase